MEGYLSKQIARYVLAHGKEVDTGAGGLHSVVSKRLEDESELEVMVGMKRSTLENPHPMASLDIRYSERPNYQGNSFGTLEYGFDGVPVRVNIHTENGTIRFIPELGIGPPLAQKDQETYNLILERVYKVLTGEETRPLTQPNQMKQLDRPSVTAPAEVKEISPELP